MCWLTVRGWKITMTNTLLIWMVSAIDFTVSLLMGCLKMSNYTLCRLPVTRNPHSIRSSCDQEPSFDQWGTQYRFFSSITLLGLKATGTSNSKSILIKYGGLLQTDRSRKQTCTASSFAVLWGDYMSKMDQREYYTGRECTFTHVVLWGRCTLELPN